MRPDSQSVGRGVALRANAFKLPQLKLQKRQRGCFEAPFSAQRQHQLCEN
jgi:hypothetical protein